ncbi:MAG: SIMPL domain-containing protein [Lachnospiraceae bacterium]|nr:SIMPL domain-containing protein [Lachnospiraceae bacterium]
MKKKKKHRLLPTVLLLSLTSACASAPTGTGNPSSVNPEGSDTHSAQTSTVTPDSTSQAVDTTGERSSTWTGAGTDSRNIITVHSSEEIMVVPDIAQIVYSVRTEAKEASACQQKNTEDVNQVIDLLKSLGVAETSIQTSDYYMNPIYNYNSNTRKITGYEAITSLTVSDLPIDNLGSILSQSVESGINNIQSITYQSSRYDEEYAKALTLAVQSAKAKAETLALAGNCRLGGVAGIHETSNYSEARYTDNALASKMRATAAAEEAVFDSAVNIMPGEVEVAVSLTVEYFIQ